MKLSSFRYFALTLLFAASTMAAATPGLWTTTGAMSVARGGHIQVRLLDGRVLVAGGFTAPSGVTATAEIYTPATGLWSLTGSLGTARANASAVVLQNGKVLVAGGSNAAGTVLASVEIYDPATGVFTAGGSMLTPRTTFTTRVLKSGLVLAVGGCPVANCLGTTIVPLKSAELYNKEANRWTATGDMTMARYSPSTALLPDGKVFLTANLGINVFTQFDIYDPTTGTWTPAGPNLYPAPSLAVGGLPGGKVIAFYDGPTYIYDPAANTFTPGPAMVHSQDGPSALLMRNGSVMVAGGGYHTSSSGRGGGHTAADGISEIYIPSANAFSATVAGGAHVFNGAATELLNDEVLLTGGYGSVLTGSLPTTVAELYSEGTEALTPQPLTFGGQIVSTASTPKVVTLHNLTSGSLAVTGVTAGGDFTQTNNCIGYVAANSTCQVDVTFSPTATGSRTGTLNVTLGDSPFADSSTLNGTGLTYALSANPAALPLTAVAGTKTQGTVTVSNVSASVSAVSLALSGAGFTQTNTCAATLASGASCVVTITFAPAKVASYPGSLTVGGAGGNVVVPITGTGGAVLLSVTPSLNFGVVAVGDDVAQNITVQNNTPVPFSFTVTNLALPYTVTNNCPASLAVNASCSINVDFAPTVAGSYNSAVTLEDNSGNSYTVGITASAAVIN